MFASSSLLKDHEDLTKSLSNCLRAMRIVAYFGEKLH